MSATGAANRIALGRARERRHRRPPPRILRAGRDELRAPAHPDPAAGRRGEAAQHLEPARRPRRDALARERAVRVPERRGDRGRGGGRRIAGDDVGRDARLAQPDRRGQPDDARPRDDDLWHGRASSPILRGP